MDSEPLNAALARFAADLTIAGEPTVFDAVVDRHLELLLDLRAAGLRWPSVLRLLKRAGAQRPDGADLSPDQFRASISRAKRRRAARTRRPTVSGTQQTYSHAEANRPYRPDPSDGSRADEREADERVVIQPEASSPAPGHRDRHDPDLSQADLDAVRRRLR